MVCIVFYLSNGKPSIYFTMLLKPDRSLTRSRHWVIGPTGESLVEPYEPACVKFVIF